MEQMGGGVVSGEGSGGVEGAGKGEGKGGGACAGRRGRAPCRWWCWVSGGTRCTHLLRSGVSAPQSRAGRKREGRVHGVVLRGGQLRDGRGWGRGGSTLRGCAHGRERGGGTGRTGSRGEGTAGSHVQCAGARAGAGCVCAGGPAAGRDDGGWANRRKGVEGAPRRGRQTQRRASGRVALRGIKYRTRETRKRKTSKDGCGGNTEKRILSAAGADTRWTLSGSLRNRTGTQ